MKGLIVKILDDEAIKLLGDMEKRGLIRIEKEQELKKEPQNLIGSGTGTAFAPPLRDISHEAENIKDTVYKQKKID